MNFEAFLAFLGNNFLYSFTIIIISFVLGWLLYNNIILKKICLREALFEKDNIAAWIEFIGAFIFPTLYLGAKAIEGTVSDDRLTDLGICIGYVVAFIVIFTILRILSGLFIKLINQSDEHGKIALNTEIYNQKNIAASLFSAAMSTMFVGIIRFLDILPENFVTSILQMSNVVVFTLIAIIAYLIVLRRKTTLFKEIFIDNNPAAGVSFLGFVFAVQIILGNAVELQMPFDLPELAIVSAISLVLFGVLSVIFKFMFTKVIKVDIWKEVYEQDNIGAAIGQIALYIGIANIIVHFLK